MLWLSVAPCRCSTALQHLVSVNENYHIFCHHSFNYFASGSIRNLHVVISAGLSLPDAEVRPAGTLRHKASSSPVAAEMWCLNDLIWQTLREPLPLKPRADTALSRPAPTLTKPQLWFTSTLRRRTVNLPVVSRGSGDVTLVRPRELVAFLYQVTWGSDNREELNYLSLQKMNGNDRMMGFGDCFSSKLMYSLLHWVWNFLQVCRCVN